LVGIALCGIVVASALWTGEIGGGGAGARKNENPFLFWMGVIITSIFGVVALAAFIFSIATGKSLD